MKQTIAFATALALSLSALAGEPAEKQPWQSPYSGDDATGAGVMALWKFDQVAPKIKDDSGHGHELTFRGRSRIVPGGKFRSCLECFPSGSGNDVKEGAGTPYNPKGLSPAGAFTIEMWIKPKPELADQKTAFLIDKKYYHYAKDLARANTEYCLYLRKAGKTQHRLIAYLGFGTESAQFDSNATALEPGEWHHVAFVYNGAGTGAFYFDGQPLGRSTHENRGAVKPGNYGLVVGDRYGSTHNGFAGFIDEVRISSREVPFFSGTLVVDMNAAGCRTAFRRMETGAVAKATVYNDTGKVLTKVHAVVQFGGKERRESLPDMPAKTEQVIDVPVDTTVRPAAYELKVSFTAKSGDKAYRVEEVSRITIAPRPLPNQMPVTMWGAGKVEEVKDIGFSHRTSWGGHFDSLVWKQGKPATNIGSARLADIGKSLDEHLAAGVGVLPHVYPGRHMIRRKYLPQVDRGGKPHSRIGPCCRDPKALEFAYNVGATIAQTRGNHPAWQGALIDSETRGHTNACFCERCKAAFKEHAGFDIPTLVQSKMGVLHTRIGRFPRNRVVPDDDPILTYYRWFWKAGDGWNELHTKTHEGLKSTGRDDIWTFYDPAVRVPSIWGSGGGVDVISQWTYSYPDPPKIAQSTDEMFAMAEGRPGQKVMKMTQIIWYRRQTAPKLPADKSKWAQWEKDIPDAAFITISPDHLSEAMWFMIARPVRGIMYHGWGSLVKSDRGSYQFTNPKTRHRLHDLIRDVIRPLGPTLLQVPDRKADVALLESFTSQVFTAGRTATFGWSHKWVADAHLVLQWAKLQPRIVYDEKILRDGLDDFKVLVMPDCEVLTESVLGKIVEFQKRGGIIVADENVCPAISPDIFLPSYRRTRRAAKEDKAALQQRSRDLRRELDDFYSRHGDADNRDVVVRFRQYRDTDYLVAVNDKRTFGKYVGHHGLVMEKGVPNVATLSIRRDDGYVYELVSHKQVDATPSADGLTFRTTFGPGEGKLFMITAQKISGVRVNVPDQARLGEPLPVAATVVDDAGAPVAAVVPVQVDVLDPKGRPAEFSGYYGAKDGRVSITVDLAANDLPGRWTVRVTELASGLSREQTLTVVR